MKKDKLKVTFDFDVHKEGLELFRLESQAVIDGLKGQMYTLLDQIRESEERLEEMGDSLKLMTRRSIATLDHMLDTMSTARNALTFPLDPDKWKPTD